MLNYLQDNIWLLAFLVLAAGTGWMFWQNRAAEKVRSALLRGITFGIFGALITLNISDIWFRLSIIAGAALASIYWTTLKEEQKRVEFAAIFVYNSETKDPLEALDRNYEYYFCQRTGSCPPEFIVSRMDDKAGKDGSGQDLYFDLFLRMIVDLLFGMYMNTWDLKLVHRVMYADRTFKWEPHDNAQLPNSNFLKREEFQRLFPDCRALSIENYGLIGDKLAVPPGTAVDANTTSIGGSLYNRTLFLKNPYVDITISLTSSSFRRGGLGDLGLVLGLTKEEGDKFSTCVFEVNLFAKFKQLKSGHPEMKRYRRWVDGMFELIQDNFDASRHRERGKEWFTLKKLSAIKE